MGYEYQKQYLESEEQYSGLGLSVLEKEFFQLDKGNEIIDPYDQTSFGGLLIYMSMDTKSHSRSIYSFLDFLGDIGGLYAILLDSGNIIVKGLTFFLGSFLQSFLVSRIFEVRDPSTSDHKHRKSRKSNQKLDQSETIYVTGYNTDTGNYSFQKS